VSVYHACVCYAVARQRTLAAGGIKRAVVAGRLQTKVMAVVGEGEQGVEGENRRTATEAATRSAGKGAPGRA